MSQVVVKFGKAHLPTTVTFLSLGKRPFKTFINEDLPDPGWPKLSVIDPGLKTPLVLLRISLLKRLLQLVSYVPQRDKHFPLLTVKETLEFAHEFAGRKLLDKPERRFSKGTVDQNSTAVDLAKALSGHYPDVVIRQLGLENCQDTIVGDVMHRGVSGGERKRVTTGEMEFGAKTVVFMDEISTGLDSAATFDIINTQRSVAKTMKKTVVIALLQPAPEVFNLFDDVMILNDGEVMYHGHRDQVENYFTSMGFVRPPGRDVADFLLDLGTKQQRQYQHALPVGVNNFPRFDRVWHSLSSVEDLRKHAKSFMPNA